MSINSSSHCPGNVRKVGSKEGERKCKDRQSSVSSKRVKERKEIEVSKCSLTIEELRIDQV